MTDEQEIRQASRLEQDDPEHCMKCGEKIPFIDGCKDDHGRPVSYVQGDAVPLELCPDCWASKKLFELRLKCDERYNGVGTEVLEE